MGRAIRQVLSYADCERLLGTETSVKLCNNTWLRRSIRGFEIVLHQIPVVTVLEDGTYALRTGGYRSATTKNRINRFSPANLFLKGYGWFLDFNHVYDNGWNVVGTVDFEEGVIVDAYGVPQTLENRRKARLPV